MQFTIDMLREAGILVMLKTSALSIDKKIKKQTQKDNALSESAKEKGASIEVHRIILQKSYLDPIYTLRGQARSFLNNKTHCIKFPMMRSVYFVPLPMIDEVRTTMADYIRQHDEQVEILAQPHRWEEAKAEARERLGELYDEDDYPRDPRHAFKLSFLEFNITNVGENPMTEVLTQFKTSTTEVLRSRMQELMQATVKGLGVNYDKDGRPTRGTLASSAFTRLSDLIRLVDSLNKNINNDRLVREYIETLRATINDAEGRLLDVTQVRKDDEYRNALSDQFADILDAFERDVEQEPTRQIITEED